MNSPVPKQIAEAKGEHQITMARFSADGVILAAAGYEPVVRRWQFDGKQLAPLTALDGFNGWTTAVAFHPKEPVLFCADSWGRLRCQQSAGDAPKITWEKDAAHDGWVRQIAVSPDGSHIATCGHDQFVRVWKASDGKLMVERKAPEDIYALAFDPEGKTLVFGDLRGHIEAWDFAANKPVRSFDGGVLYKLDRLQDIAGLRTLLFIEGGKTLVASGTTPQNGATPQSIPTILFFDYATGKLAKTLTHGTNKEGWIHDLVLHPDGYLIAVTSGAPGSGMIFLAKPEDKAPFHVNTKLPNCHTIALHPDGRHFVVTSTNRDSNGNGRTLKDGKYPGNTSPLHVFELGA